MDVQYSIYTYNSDSIAMDVACGVCDLRTDIQINLKSRWGVKQPLGKYLPINGMWFAVFQLMYSDVGLHEPMHKDDTPICEWLNKLLQTKQ